MQTKITCMLWCTHVSRSWIASVFYQEEGQLQHAVIKGGKSISGSNFSMEPILAVAVLLIEPYSDNLHFP